MSLFLPPPFDAKIYSFSNLRLSLDSSEMSFAQSLYQDHLKEAKLNSGWLSSNVSPKKKFLIKTISFRKESYFYVYGIVRVLLGAKDYKLKLINM